MKIADRACRANGFVNPSFVDVRTGEIVPFRQRHNTLSYMSAEAMAAAFGGDPSYIPSEIGFIYGSAEGSFSGEITRSQDWNSLLGELESNKADVQVVRFSYSPSLGGEKGSGGSDSSGSDSSSSSVQYDEGGDYTNIKPTGSNAITFHAVSNSQDEGARKTSAFKKNDYVYQAVLLGYHQGKHYVISRVSLFDDDLRQYLRKPDNFEVALDWTIVFR
jgi:hypothetical protein